MAIAFAHVSIHTRAKGHSSVAASAYRTGTRLTDERTGLTYDFTRRSDVIYSEVLLPTSSNDVFKDRQYLWNQVEFSERRQDSQVCKDVVLALPKELGLAHQIELTKRFAQMHFVEKGLAADIAIHDHDDGNPHAHILITTRRIEIDHLSKYKARDLNPSFARGSVVEKDLWGEHWRELQNEFFKEKNIDLSVDLNHLIPERHQGNFRDSSTHYLHEENNLIRDAREEIALFHVDNLINQLSLTNSVFSRRDIERLLFKTVSKSENPSQFLNCVEQILTHHDVIRLGVNDRGIESYTTRHQYVQETKLLDHVQQLQVRKSHVFNTSIESFAKRHHLNEEQREAFSFITLGDDISVMVGRPGSGKSHLLKPLKEYYETHGCHVLGASLSGKVAKSLQSDTGINSSTIASLTYRLSRGTLKLTKDHVLVIDEAGMVDFTNMAYLLSVVNKAQAKIILVGDPAQLKPINKGEIFRGIAARTGYIELAQIKRQLDEGDKMASLQLAKGQIAEALSHYDEKRVVRFAETPQDALTEMVDAWKKDLNSESVKRHIILAFTRTAVSSLNEKARTAMQDANIVSTNSFEYFSENGTRRTLLAEGDRILLRQNDKTLGVRNGDLATIKAINENQFSAILDSGETVIIPKSYQYVEYGYALTVHKSQGMTIDKASVLIDSSYWDRHLSFVAFTRHREKLNIYADKMQHPTLDRLTKTLARESTRDNVIDWPLDYAIRYGFEPDGLIGRVINHIAGVANQVKEKWSYLVHYELYLKATESQNRISEREVLRATAKEMADFLDEKNSLSKKIVVLQKDAHQKKVAPSTLPLFESIYEQSLARDQRAHNIITAHGKTFERLKDMQTMVDPIKHDAARYDRYLAIKMIAASSDLKPTHALIPESTKVDLKKDYMHVVRLASKHSMPVSSLYQKVETLQKINHQLILNQLKKEYPILIGYDQLLNEVRATSRYKQEQINRVLFTKANEIIGNKPLYERLQRDLPKLLISLTTRVKEHGKNRGIDR